MTQPRRTRPALVVALALGVVAGACGAVGLVSWLFTAPPIEAPIAHAAAPLAAPLAVTRPTPHAASEPPGERPAAARSMPFAQTAYPALTTVYEWPREPESPEDVRDDTFTEALVVLCGPFADRQVRTTYAPLLLAAARAFHADPFLLGALMFHMSGCRQRTSSTRRGLTGVPFDFYSSQMARPELRYPTFDDGRWRTHTLPLDRFPFQRAYVDSPESNFYFAAAFLRVWSEQARGLRVAFEQPSEYRHYVSHYVWGDRVASHREEDWILVERRRLLEYYGATRPRPPVTWRGFALGCPLDGCPRVVTSKLGDSRAHGARTHAGNDFESTHGEPVRAVGDGRVIFAGVDLPGRGAAARIPIWAQRDVDSSEMGAGGLYVCIDHGQSTANESLISCYMHLDRVTVVQDRTVARGEQIGIVGTTGIKESRPHLHFELHSTRGVHDSSEVLVGLALGAPTPKPPRAGPVMHVDDF